MFKRLTLPVTLAVSPAVFECDRAPPGDAADNPTVTVRDSAGVEIVEGLHAYCDEWGMDRIASLVGSLRC